MFSMQSQYKVFLICVKVAVLELFAWKRSSKNLLFKPLKIYLHKRCFCRILSKDFRKKKKSFYRRHFSGSLLSLEFKLHLKRFVSASELAPLLIYKSFIYYRAETRLTGLVLFRVISS